MQIKKNFEKFHRDKKGMKQHTLLRNFGKSAMQKHTPKRSRSLCSSCANTKGQNRSTFKRHACVIPGIHLFQSTERWNLQQEVV